MIQLDFRSQSRTKNPTPTLTPSVVRNLTPTPPKNLLTPCDSGTATLLPMERMAWQFLMKKSNGICILSGDGR